MNEDLKRIKEQLVETLAAWERQSIQMIKSRGTPSERQFYRGEASAYALAQRLVIDRFEEVTKQP